MTHYDPDTAPGPHAWLALDEDVRLKMVIDHHRENRIEVANERLHAALHLAVENQLAIGERVVVETVARLQGEGLSRHDAIHAVGTVLADQIVQALRGHRTKEDLAATYLSDLSTLTAESWRAGER